MAAIAYDIDGTLTTADKHQVSRLSNLAKSMNVKEYINTARPRGYCTDPDPITTKLAPKSKHHCMVGHDPPTSKVINMEKIYKHSGIQNKRCAILIDDRPENIKAVENHGYTGILVNDKTGIRKKHVDKIHRIMHECQPSNMYRGTSNEIQKWKLVLLLILISIVMIALVDIFVKIIQKLKQ